EMGAGDDLLARVAALADAEGLQALQRELLRRPLRFRVPWQAGQAVLQVGARPVRAAIPFRCPPIGFAVERDVEGPGTAAAAHVELQEAAQLRRAVPLRRLRGSEAAGHAGRR